MTEFTRCPADRHQHPLPATALTIGSTSVASVYAVRGLGIFPDTDLVMRTHVVQIVSCCCAALCQRLIVRRLVSTSVFPVIRPCPRAQLTTTWTHSVIWRSGIYNLPCPDSSTPLLQSPPLRPSYRRTCRSSLVSTTRKDNGQDYCCLDKKTIYGIVPQYVRQFVRVTN